MRKHQNVMVLPAWPLWRTLPHPWGIPEAKGAPPTRLVPTGVAPERPMTPAAVARRARNVCRAMSAIERRAVEPEALRSAHPVSEPSAEIFAHPAVVGLLLALFPPVGLTLLWATDRIPREGKIAISLISTLALSIAGVAFFFA